MKIIFHTLLYYIIVASLLGTGGAQAANLVDSPEARSVQPAQNEAATINMQVTVRDFAISHPDFEQEITFGLTPGLVDSTIGSDRKPVFAGPNGAGAITNSETFNQWYNDVPGVNQSMEFLLPLTETSPGSQIFTYKNNAFFPIDQQLFGNEGLLHNFHFTLELHTTFEYQGGEVFTFFGDDDVWVFINDQLVVDLGGVHPEASTSVELDTLGLTVGESYSLDLFYAERHTFASHFGLTTSIILETEPTFAISGRVIDENSDPVSGVTVSIGQGLSTATGIDGNYSLPGLPDGSYTVVPSKSGYTFTPESYVVSQLSDATELDFTANLIISDTVSVEVLVETAEDHFLDATLTCYRASPDSPLRCASTASAPVQVNVREAVSKSPVPAQLTLHPDETIIGITGPAGMLSHQIPITETAVAQQRVITVSADVNEESVSSAPLIVYTSVLTTAVKETTLTQDEADAYALLFPQAYVRNAQLSSMLCDALLEEACVQSQVAWLITELGGSNYVAMAGDVIREEIYQYTEPSGNVKTVYALVQQILRQGSTIATQTVWSENALDFTSRQIIRDALVFEVDSSVILNITDPQGRKTGVISDTPQIQFGFPVGISDTGAEQHTLIVPNATVGLYQVQLIGGNTGSFTVDLYTLNQNGQATPSQRVAQDLDTGVVITCTLNYDPAQEQQQLVCPNDLPFKFYLPDIYR